ncbi:MAG TPA: polysaccharide deacetylase family protein [Vicinamibacterales bacterium]
MRTTVSLVLLAFWLAAQDRAPALRVAVTFDDLPIAGDFAHDAATSRAVTTRLLDTFAQHRIPVVGFVIASKVLRDGKPDPEQVALLNAWLDRRMELGNHTYSHRDFHASSLEEMQADVIRADQILKPILREHAAFLRFFRHPFLHTGRDAKTRTAFEDFLASRGYRVAPVTIDNDDYVFAAAYDRAVAQQNADATRRIAGTFVSYMEDKFSFFERNSGQLFGRQITQVLLLHVNQLNAATFDRLAGRLEARGYQFVPLTEALKDSAFATRDEYFGPAGITWLHRWALTMGMPKTFYEGEPETPAWITAK